MTSNYNSLKVSLVWDNKIGTVFITSVNNFQIMYFFQMLNYLPHSISLSVLARYTTVLSVLINSYPPDVLYGHNTGKQSN